MTETCDGCNKTVHYWKTMEDAGGEYEVCPFCGRRNDGLGNLQDHFSL